MDIPLSSSSSSDIEHKPKRPSNIHRFRNRCRQMLALTRQHNILRRRFRKSTTCDISSDEVLPDENNLESSKSTPMNRIRHGGTRRFSLVKLELPTGDSNASSTDDGKSQIPSSSPNLIQKLLFRQFSPKTRPCSTGISSDDSASQSNDILHNYAGGGRRITTPTTPKHSWSNSSSSNNCKQIVDTKDNLLLSPPNTILSKNDGKSQIPSSSPNLIQKLLFRQFSPKTRPCSTGISSDDSASQSNDILHNYAGGGRRITTPTTPKHSWSNSSSSNNCKQIVDTKDNLLLSPPNTILSKSQQLDLTSYLSRRRNTTGSISLNKIVDLKNTPSGTTLKLSAASPFGNSNNRLSTENIFQIVEDSDLFATKQLLHVNEKLVNSYNEYDWCPLDIAIMLNNIPMIRLLVEYGGEESSKIQPEECRYQSVCHQLTILSQQNSDETIKKSSSNKLTTDDVQLRRSSPSNDTQQRHRRISKGQQEQLQIQQQQQQQFYQQRTLTLTQMKDNYEQAGENKKKKRTN
ncbi:unnamed protein product [Rotaria sp. Silwood1]|nr:unnamed protein product [Rotaria sp. Silwood1]